MLFYEICGGENSGGTVPLKELCWTGRTSSVPMSSSIVEIVLHVWACGVEKREGLEKGWS
jgi:hypothetical protein